MKKVLHQPNLDTILMVEKAIKDAKEYPTRADLWRSLPRKTQYQTFKRILSYIEASNKIIFNGRTIVWIAVDNQKLKKLFETYKRVR